jgi:3-phenylpropionate/trans-cinnamate dioxygenase ferredoxin subunit
MAFYILDKIESIEDDSRRVFEVNGRSLLLIHHQQRFFCVENKCGHFGNPLEEGEIEGNAIFCPVHGISWNLETGEIDNRPYENADPIATFKVEISNGEIGVEIPETRD